MRYRPDIDGLRTIAVLPVVFFHGGMISGGFVGVDVFFVISGYLITMILYEDARSGRLSIIRFYDRRIRRILPALFVVFGVTTLFALWLLTANDLVMYSRSLIAAVAFVSNIYFWKANDYFADGGDPAPLLHTWSLGVEEQFYIFFPILIYLFARFFRLTLLPFAVIAVGVISFGLSWYGSIRVPNFAFYMLPARAWELLAGSIIAIPFLPTLRPWMGRTLAALGIAGILVACFFYTSKIAFPGLAAALPVFGAAFVVYGGLYSGGGLASWLLSRPPMVYIGKTSYSLYLWHWPILVFGAQYFGGELSTAQALVLIALSFAAAVLSYHFVETPFRTGAVLALPWKRFSAAGAAMAAFAVCAQTLILTKGLPIRMPEAASTASAARFDRSPAENECLVIPKQSELPAPARAERCTFGAAPGGTYQVALWGDSHGSAMVPGVVAAFTARGQSVRQITLAGCPPLLGASVGVRDGGYRCRTFNDLVVKELALMPKGGTVFIVGRWRNWLGSGRVNFLKDDLSGAPSQEDSARAFDASLDRSIAAVRALGLKPVIVGPVPEFLKAVPGCASRALFHGFDASSCYRIDAAQREKLLGPAEAALARAQKRWPDVTFLMPASAFCDVNGCDARIDGRIAYRDSHHLNQTAAKILLPRLLKAAGYATSGSAALH
ncbi:acyltransferase family protein [Xanthobacter sp. KR7-225]|uniref:acyltransferase family protein n=1 Tax=Xanthobacter sp. KR7-225 TaxID=3156613 RepID=UPI0032B3356F